MIKFQLKSEFLMPFVGVAMVSSLANVDAVFALTFEETTRGALTFYDNQNDQIGSGSFTYTSNPIEGNFVQTTSDFIFVEDIDELGSVVPIDIISITAEDNFSLITDINAEINGVELEPIFDSSLVSGSSFSTVLLFQPTANEFFIPDMNSVAGIETGDARDPNLDFSDRWFLSDSTSGVQASQQVVLSDDGRLFGFILNETGDSAVDGVWTAQAVPEPLTIFGAGIAIAFGTSFKRKLAKTNKK